VTHSFFLVQATLARIARRFALAGLVGCIASPVLADSPNDFGNADSVSDFYELATQGMPEAEAPWNEPASTTTTTTTTTATTTSERGADIEVIRERHANRRIKIEREVTLDADGNYVNHGTWKMWDLEGKPTAEGHYNMGQRTGLWTRWYNRNDSSMLREHPFNRFKAPFVSQVTFEAGKMDGDWIIFDSNQQKCSLITFQNGERNGIATTWLPDGQVFYEAGYEHGYPNGDVMQRNRAGKFIKGTTYVNGHEQTTKVSYFSGTKNKKTEATFLAPKTELVSTDDFWQLSLATYSVKGEDKRHGPWRSWYSNGQKQLEGIYEQDAESGTFTWWHSNGQVAVRGEFNTGKQNGSWVWWHANGQKATLGEYLLGAQTGQWRRWSTDGQLDQQTYYDRGNAELTPTKEEPVFELGQNPAAPQDGPQLTR